MVSRGARHFIFLSRSGADKPEAAALVEELHELTRSKHTDLTVQVVRGDVSVKDDVGRAVSSATKPIKGVVQAAMVLKVCLIALYPYMRLLTNSMCSNRTNCSQKCHSMTSTR
jgi:hypothetical protein